MIAKDLRISATHSPHIPLRLRRNYTLWSHVFSHTILIKTILISFFAILTTSRSQIILPHTRLSEASTLLSWWRMCVQHYTAICCLRLWGRANWKEVWCRWDAISLVKPIFVRDRGQRVMLELNFKLRGVIEHSMLLLWHNQSIM